MSVNSKIIEHITMAISLFIMLPGKMSAQMPDEEYNQIAKNTTPRSPSVSMMNRFANYPVDYSTGVPNISIPIYTIKAGNFQLPISIDYHASGIRVQDVSTPVGLGWTLNAGGCISAMIKGSKDGDSLSFKNVEELHAFAKKSYQNDDYWKMYAFSVFDTQEDRYTYSFCDKHGVFRKDVNNVYHTFPYSKLSVTETSNHFRLVDEEGNTYFFDGPGPADENYNKAYYLTRIILADKSDSIVFKYKKGASYYSDVCGDYKYDYVSYKNSGEVSDRREASMKMSYSTEQYLLTNIMWNGNRISFCYLQDRKDKGNGLDRLSSIKITNYRNESVKNVKFSQGIYGRDNCSYRMFLNNLSLSGPSGSSESETYRFTYCNPGLLPCYYNSNIKLNSICNEDLWGYYSSGYEAWVPAFWGNYYCGGRSPSPILAKYGSLSSITYPSGGKTLFDMEVNSLNGKPWGGLRIKDMRSYDKDGTLLSTKTYAYHNAKPSIAEDDLSKLFSTQKKIFYYDGTYGDYQWIYMANPIISLSADYGSPIYYDNVTEYAGTETDNSGRTEYSYIDQRTNDMDSNPTCNMDEFSNLSLYCYSQCDNFDFGNLSRLLDSKTVFDKDGKKLSYEKYNYADELMKQIALGYKVVSNVLYLSTPPFNGSNSLYNNPNSNYIYSEDLACTDVIGLQSYKRLTCKTTEKNGIKSIASYMYDADHRTLSPITVTEEQQDCNSKTEYTYPFSIKNAVNDSMMARNMIVPIKVTNYRNGVIAKTDSIAYGLRNGAFVPTSIYCSINGNPLKHRLAYNYNKQNRMCNIIKDDTENTIFLWGYNGMYPVAKIEGIALSGFCSIMQSMGKDPYGSSLTADDLNNLRKKILEQKGFITIYDYKPLIGLNYTIDPTGRKTSYTYDSMGYLKEIYDNNGVLTDNYEFNYAK